MMVAMTAAMIRGMTDVTPTPTPDPDPPGTVVNIMVVPVTNGIELSQEGGTVTGSGIYYTGNEATFTATANEGFTFQGWSYTPTGEIVNSDNPATFTIENRTYYGQFVTSA